MCSHAPLHSPSLQPRYSIFRLFDDVLLLGKGGCVKLGPAGQDALLAGSSSGPAAYSLAIASAE